jgi:hypothetical protein
MSLSALKKQINKANQYLSESVGAAEATKLDDAFNEMERVSMNLLNEINIWIAKSIPNCT